MSARSSALLAGLPRGGRSPICAGVSRVLMRNRVAAPVTVARGDVVVAVATDP